MIKETTNICLQETMNKNDNNTMFSPTMPLKRTKTSILPDQNNVVEILGHYWPRILLHQNNNKTTKKIGNNKKEDKKAVKKSHRQRRRNSDMKLIVTSSQNEMNNVVVSPTSPICTTSTTPTTSPSPSPVNVPSLIMAEPRLRFSTITGRPITTMPQPVKKQCCGIRIPDKKSLRKMQRRRLYSDESTATF